VHSCVHNPPYTENNFVSQKTKKALFDKQALDKKRVYKKISILLIYLRKWHTHCLFLCVIQHLLSGETPMTNIIRKTHDIFSQRILAPLFQLILGIVLGLTGSFSVPCYAGGLDDEKQGTSIKSGKLFGGIVVHLQKLASSGDVRILIDLTPLSANGAPVCQKPSGKMVSVLAGRGFDHHREHSAFVVIPDPSDPLPRNLMVGDCLTVDGNDVDRVSRPTLQSEDSIQIVPSLAKKEKGVQVVRAFFLKLWPETPSLSQEAHSGNLLPKVTPSFFPAGKHRKA
jgi:hypothetical protein